MKVSRSGYYGWLNRPESKRDKENRDLRRMIKEIFIENRNIYGTRRIAIKLAAKGVFISRHRIGKLMALEGICCRTRRKFKVTLNK